MTPRDVADSFTEGREAGAWLRHIYGIARDRAAAAGVEMAEFESFWKAGYVEHAEPETPYDMFAAFRADPVAHPLQTPSGRIEIFSETIAGFGYEDCPGHPVWLEPVEWLGSPQVERFPLHLISNQPRTRLHGQLDPGGVSRERKIAGREPNGSTPAMRKHVASVTETWCASTMTKGPVLPAPM